MICRFSVACKRCANIFLLKLWLTVYGLWFSKTNSNVMALKIVFLPFMLDQVGNIFQSAF